MKYLNEIIVGIITGLASSFLYQHLWFKYRFGKKKELMKVLNDFSNWITLAFANEYYYEKDPDYIIQVGPNQEIVNEKYKVFPDKEHNYLNHVVVKYKGAILTSWNFMLLDGGNVFIPFPRHEYRPDKSIYEYYDVSSIEVKIYRIVQMYHKDYLEGLNQIARRLNIEVNDIS